MKDENIFYFPGNKTKKHNLESININLSFNSKKIESLSKKSTSFLYKPKNREIFRPYSKIEYHTNNKNSNILSKDNITYILSNSNNKIISKKSVKIQKNPQKVLNVANLSISTKEKRVHLHNLLLFYHLFM